MDNENDGLINNHFSIDKHKLPICEYQNATKNLIKKEFLLVICSNNERFKIAKIEVKKSFV